jgi:hypothetical protein
VHNLVLFVADERLISAHFAEIRCCILRKPSNLRMLPHPALKTKKGKHPADASPSYSNKTRFYLLNSISRYLGSGQKSSATTFSKASALRRISAIKGTTWSP